MDFPQEAQMSTETTPIPNRPGFGRRLVLVTGRFLKALLKVALIVAVIAGAGYITYLIVKELQRSFDVVNEQVAFNRAQVLEIAHDLGALQQTATAAAAVQDERLANLESHLETTLAVEMARQEAALATLELQLGNLLSQTQALDGAIVTLNTGMVALQTDSDENNGRLDSLGAELVTLSNHTDELGAQVADLQTAVADLPLADIYQMRQVITLFRVWEVVARARLRLVENNAGLAATDTAHALALIEAIIAHDNTDPDLLPQLARVHTRLKLAEAYLPANPDLAALDLENAWRELDEALALLLGAS